MRLIERARVGIVAIVLHVSTILLLFLVIFVSSFASFLIGRTLSLMVLGSFLVARDGTLGVGWVQGGR